MKRRPRFITLNDLKDQARPGDRAIYTTEQAPGAIPNGHRVSKIAFEPGDHHAVGATAIVLGSLGPDDRGEFGYFVRWEGGETPPTFIRGRKIERIDP